MNRPTNFPYSVLPPCCRVLPNRVSTQAFLLSRSRNVSFLCSAQLPPSPLPTAYVSATTGTTPTPPLFPALLLARPRLAPGRSRCDSAGSGAPWRRDLMSLFQGAGGLHPSEQWRHRVRPEARAREYYLTE